MAYNNIGIGCGCNDSPLPVSQDFIISENICSQTKTSIGDNT